MENLKQIHSYDDASENICLLPSVGGRTQEAPKSKPDILMATKELHNCRPVKESFLKSETLSFLNRLQLLYIT